MIALVPVFGVLAGLLGVLDTIRTSATCLARSWTCSHAIWLNAHPCAT
jgi:hypothetical protein